MALSQQSVKKREQQSLLRAVVQYHRATDTALEILERQLEAWRSKKLLLERNDVTTIEGKWNIFEAKLTAYSRQMAALITYINSR